MLTICVVWNIKNSEFLRLLYLSGYELQKKEEMEVLLFLCCCMENQWKDTGMSQDTKQDLKAQQFFFSFRSCSFLPNPLQQENRWEQFLKEMLLSLVLNPLTSHSSSSVFHFWLYLILRWDAEFIKRGGGEDLKFLEWKLDIWIYHPWTFISLPFALNWIK